MVGVQLSQGYGATMRRHFPFYQSIPRFPGVPASQLIVLERIKAELTLEPPSGLGTTGTTGLGIQRLRH